MKKTISILVAVSMIVVAGTVAGCTGYIENLSTLRPSSRRYRNTCERP